MDSKLKNRLVNNAFYEGGMTEDFVFGAEWMYMNQVLPLIKQNDELSQQLVDRSEKYKQFMESGLDVQMLKNKQLEKENDQLEDKVYHSTRLVEELRLENEELKQKLEVAKKALEFYTDENNQTDQQCCNMAVQVGDQEWACCGSAISSYQLDSGKTARQALKEIGE